MVNMPDVINAVNRTQCILVYCCPLRKSGGVIIFHKILWNTIWQILNFWAFWQIQPVLYKFHLSLCKKHWVHLYLHIERVSEIGSQVVSWDTSGDACSCQVWTGRLCVVKVWSARSWVITQQTQDHLCDFLMLMMMMMLIFHFELLGFLCAYGYGLGCRGVVEG